MDGKLDLILAGIAKQKLGIGHLEMRGADHLDFVEVCVASIKEALETAYHAGLAAGNGKPMAEVAKLYATQKCDHIERPDSKDLRNDWRCFKCGYVYRNELERSSK